MTKDEIKTKLIEAGIKNLKEFGYEQVDKDNILTDDIYSQFFRSMLNDNLSILNKSLNSAIIDLLETIKR